MTGSMTASTADPAPPVTAAPPSPGSTASRHAPRATLRRRTAVVLAAFGIVITGMVVTVLLALLSLTHRGNDITSRWSPAVVRSSSLLGDLVNQETGVRGFAISRQEQFLAPYHVYLRREMRDEAALQQLVGGRPELAQDLARFRAEAATWRRTVAQPFIARVRAGDPTVSRDVVSAAAKNSFDRVRSTGATLQNGIAAARDHALAQRQSALRLVWISGGVAAAITLLAFPLIWWGLQSAVLVPVERLAVQTRAVAGGELERTIAPSGPLEVYRLGVDVDRMRARIATELAKVESARQVLVTRGEELARSNADLEQFAYVASHDLSEPLRKVANFCQLLERQYAPQLDDKAKQYIAFAVDGAKRMQVLIGDLLAFSRVGRTTEHFAAVPLDEALDRALAHLDDRLTETGATVHRDPLPTVDGDFSLLTALFQNLVGNAVKYRDESRAPEIRISSELRDGEWHVVVQDNGIGIDPQYAERIFIIFQRLHLRDRYGGTGIGLALCRRIVEFHGGRIWLDPGSDSGARFHFTIPERRDPTEPTDADTLGVS